MYKICKTEQSAKRQRMLAEGLLNAMLEQPYEEITISDLCGRLQVPRKTFYRYFENKEDALHALIDQTLLDYQKFELLHMGEVASGDGADLELYFMFWEQHKLLLDVLRQCSLSAVLVERVLLNAMNEARQMRKYLNVDNEAEARAAILFVIGGLTTMVIEWHSTGCQQSIGQMAETARKLLRRPLILAKN